MRKTDVFGRMALAGTLLAAGLAACQSSADSNGSGSDASGLASCPDGNEIFSVPPVQLSRVSGWEPLGHMGPSAHTFPTDHQYLYLRNPDVPAGTPLSEPVLAPAPVRITGLYKSTYSATGITDYTVYFQPCADVKGRFGHMGSIAAKLAAAAGPIDQSCSTYEPTPGFPVTQCASRNFRYDAAAAETLGTAGDGGSIALDWWLWDRRAPSIHFADPARFVSVYDPAGFNAAKTVAASEYFTATVAAQVAAKVGRYDGGLARTVSPRGGTIAVDVDSTARGYWFNPAQPYPPESYHAALAPDYLTPDTTQAFSIGLSQPNVGSRFVTFRPRDTGFVNRPFETVRADGIFYCYETTPNLGVIWIRLVDPGTLRLEVRPETASCAASAPFTFTADAFDYKR